MSDMYESYVKLVNEVVERYGNTTRIIEDDHVSPEELNRALAEYLPNSMVLIGEYQMAKVDYAKVQIKYQEWYDTKFTETKRAMNEGAPASKKFAVKEYETDVRVNNRLEYSEWQSELSTAEMKVNFMRRLVEIYKKYDNILTSLSNNSRQEMRTLSIGNRMNATPEGVNKNKVRNSFPNK